MVDAADPPDVVGGGQEVLRFLSASPDRVALLRTLRGSTLDARTLRQRLVTSRSTVHRHLSQLRERGWIEETAERAHALTPLGRLIVDRYDEATREFGRIESCSPFLRTVPDGFVPPRLLALDPVAVETRSADRPHHVLERYLERLRGLEGPSVVAAFSTMSGFHAEALRDLLEGEVQLCVVLSSATPVDPEGPLDDVRRSDRSTVLQSADLQPVDLIRSGDATVLATYDDGRLCAYLVSTDDRLAAWADDHLASAVEDATAPSALQVSD